MEALLSEGEGLTVEYAECINSLNSSVFETVCSFSNRYGGHLLLGVDDSGQVLGVNRNAAKDIRNNFSNMLNNPQKMSPTLYLALEELEWDGKLILWTYVPMSSQVELCNGKVYDRIEDADIDITRSTDLVANLYQRKSSMYTERKIFPYVTEDHLLLQEMMPRVKALVSARTPDVPWKELTDMEILKGFGLYEEDFLTGIKGFNLAAILLFGKDEVIRSCAPGYVTDAIFRAENTDRYDDRLIVECNLIDAYDKLIGFIEKHTLDRFFLVDNLNVSVRSWIAREVVSNLLVHR